MATDDTLYVFTPLHAHFPASNPATLDMTAAPHPVLDYDDAVDETAYFTGLMPGQYDGTTALRVYIHWKFSTFVGSQTCEWEVSFYRMANDADSGDSYSFAAAQAVLANEASATGEWDYANIAFTNAQADGVQPNEQFVLRLLRDSSAGTASPGDAEVSLVEIRLQ